MLPTFITIYAKVFAYCKPAALVDIGRLAKPATRAAFAPTSRIKGKYTLWQCLLFKKEGGYPLKLGFLSLFTEQRGL